MEYDNLVGCRITTFHIGDPTDKDTAPPPLEQFYYAPSLLPHYCLYRLLAAPIIASLLLSDLSLQQLAEMADRILEVSHVPTVAPVTDPNVSEMRQLTATLTRLVAALDTTLSHSRETSDGRRQSRSPASRSSSRQQSRSSSPSGLCWYHRRFGPNARKCRPPCTHSGNDQASH